MRTHRDETDASQHDGQSENGNNQTGPSQLLFAELILEHFASFLVAGGGDPVQFDTGLRLLNSQDRESGD